RSLLVVCVFFFQAEDGIRDGHVTGVQTCALPISAGRPRRRGARVGRHAAGQLERAAPRGNRRAVLRRSLRGGSDDAHRWSARREIGRASCRERGERWGGGVGWERRRGEWCGWGRV